MVVLAACGAQPAAPMAPTTELPPPACQAAPQDPAGDDEVRAQLARELDSIDRELDAIDDELVASEMAAGMGREQALVLVATRIDDLGKQTIDEPRPQGPLRMLEISDAYAEARANKADLATHFGPKHSAMIAAEHNLAWLRDEFEDRRKAELAELSAWRAELEKLPHGAPAPRVRQARLRALRTTLALAPSDAPAQVWLAAQDIAHASRDLETMVDLGPKHPDRLQVEAELAAGKHRLESAVAAATAEIDAELARLDSTTSAPFSIDAAKIARRAELATQARELRRAYELRER